MAYAHNAGNITWNITKTVKVTVEVEVTVALNEHQIRMGDTTIPAGVVAHDALDSIRIDNVYVDTDNIVLDEAALQEIGVESARVVQQYREDQARLKS